MADVGLLEVILLIDELMEKQELDSYTNIQVIKMIYITTYSIITVKIVIVS